MTVYVDVLFVVNFFITYLLLLLTNAISKSGAKTARLLIASFFGGAYSLVIFLDCGIFVSIIGKLAASVIIVLSAFPFKRLTVFLKRLFIFYFSNLVFLGVILGIQLLIRSNAVRVIGGVPYFDISARTLVLSALFAYLISLAVIAIHNRLLSKKEIYLIRITKGDKAYSLYAFADSGNRLREPFSGYPVIIADKEKIDLECDRIIPYQTVGGDGMLKAFKPDSVVISSQGRSIETDRVYVALSGVDSKDYSAILNTDLLKGEL